jgi:hypothetical protein
MRTCSFRLQIASAAAMAVALTVCSVARAEFRAEADRLALEIDLVTGETLQPWWNACLAPCARWSRRRAGRLAKGEGTPCGNLFEAGTATRLPASDITALSS